MKAILELFKAPTKEYIEKTIRTKGELKLRQIQYPYMDTEAKTWDTQLLEAQAYQKDSQAITPLITQLALDRAISKADLASKIMENANAFRTAAGAILGQQQKFLDELKVTSEENLKQLLTTIIAW